MSLRHGNTKSLEESPSVFGAKSSFAVFVGFECIHLGAEKIEGVSLKHESTKSHEMSPRDL